MVHFFLLKMKNGINILRAFSVQFPASEIAFHNFSVEFEEKEILEYKKSQTISCVIWFFSAEYFYELFAQLLEYLCFMTFREHL